MRDEEDHEIQIDKTKAVINAAVDSVNGFLGCGGRDLPVSLDFSLKIDGVSVRIEISEYGDCAL